MIKKILLLLVISFTSQLYAQIIVLDEKDHSPIPFAQIINSNGAIIGATDISGNLPNLSTKDNVIFIQHIAYETKEIKLKNLVKKKYIYLSPRIYNIDAVTVKAPKAEYVYLKGYYRSYQLNDSCLKYYEDGIVEFYIPMKGRNIERKIIEYRTLQNKELTGKDKIRKFHVSDIHVSLPYLERKTLIESRKNKYQSEKDSANYIPLLFNNSPVGMIKKDTMLKTCRIELDILATEKKQTLTLFGYTTRLAAGYNTETYKLKKDYYSQLDLLNKKDYRKIFYKYKKDEKEQQIEVINEFYVLNHSYKTKDKVKEELRHTENTADSNKTHYNYEFWNLPEIPKLSMPLELLLKNKME